MGERIQTGLRVDPDELKTLVWSRPDSPRPAICSRCQGGLPDVRVLIFRSDGSAISLCDACFERMVYLVR